MSLNVALAYCPHDEDQAHRWFDWCRELGCGAKHSLTVLPFKGLVAPDIKGWASVTVLRDYSGVKSDWLSKEGVRDAAGPNFTFREMAKHFHAKQLGPWLWMEPDAIFLRSTAIDEIESEYLACGKQFMGTVVENELTPKHLSGIAVYPQDLALLSLENYMRPRMARFIVNGQERIVEAAFDVAGAPDALKDAHHTELIEYVFRGPPITTQAQFDAINPKAVIFHTDKTGSLLPFIRNRKAGDAKCSASVQTAAPIIPMGGAAESLTSNGAAPSNPVPAQEPDERHAIITLQEAQFAKQLMDLSIRLLRVETALANPRLKVPAPCTPTNGPTVVSNGSQRKRARKLKPHVRRTAEEQAKINARMAKARAARKAKA